LLIAPALNQQTAPLSFKASVQAGRKDDAQHERFWRPERLNRTHQLPIDHSLLYPADRHDCKPTPPLAIITASVRELPHLAQRNFGSFSGTRRDQHLMRVADRPWISPEQGVAGFHWRQTSWRTPFMLGPREQP
jgi:hypothetical protein